MLSWLLGCDSTPDLRPTRGYVLISIDTLRADHLGVFGYERPTTPFIDSLAARGVLFENAFVQLPGTLPSHMSMLTGLYPEEHAVISPDSVLPTDILTISERFHAAGFTTAGHSEGGYVHGSYGFSRGFDEWSHESLLIESDAERTFARGVDFLRALDPDEDFFLFLHTYSVHDPYFPLDRHSRYPQERYNSLYWEGPAPDVFEPTGPNLNSYNRGHLELSPEGLEYFEARYDASINYVDDVIRDFFEVLKELGLLDDVTVILTSDHGEEFLEHSGLAHFQAYPETLHVPLILVHPEIRSPKRVRRFVESIDITPTLLDLANLEIPKMSGESLVPAVSGEETSPAPPSEAYAIEADGAKRILLRRTGETLYQGALQSHPANGVWVEKLRTFEVLAGTHSFVVRAFHEPRTMTVRIDRRGIGNEVIERTFEVLPDRETPLEFEVDEASRITISAPSCNTPAELGISDDVRCLSFRIWGDRLHNYELYDLSRDPNAQENLALQQVEVLADLLRRLRTYRLVPLSETAAREIDPELEQRLRALGYL
ncbi:MAG: sulfatase [Thermoanaerobaculia bacterium]|nr:sulfatase [Thermoanaerobaculia bacterium]